MLKISAVLISILLVGTISSCKHQHGPDTHTHNSDGTVDKSGPEWTSDYICPMHCKSSGSNEEGTCPVCNMKLVKNKDKSTNNNHDGEDHSGHDHDGHSHDGHDHDLDGHNHHGHDH